MNGPARIEQVVGVDTCSIQISFDPAMVLPALARALAGAEGKLLAVRVLPPDHPTHQQAHTELVALLVDVFTVSLNQGQADALLTELHEAATLPDQCFACDAFAVVTVEGLLLCLAHARARDEAES